jgi:tetratricopeptide (TPR) repeat protein
VRPADHAEARPKSPGPAAPERNPRRFVVDIAPEGGLRLRLDVPRPRLSLCMIVRDNAKTLAACLESIRPWVDEMIVVDTGSVDETPRIVESFGARLFHFPWCDDFSAARNESLRHATGDWIFWMDSDDTIPPECGRGLRELVDAQNDGPAMAYVMQVHCPGGGENGDPTHNLTVVDHVKLFRNRPELRFDGRMHEQILGAIRRLGGEIGWSELYVVHSGSDQSPAAQARKLERDLRLLTLELTERPEHPFTLFNLGMTHAHANRFAEASGFLRRSIAASHPSDSHVRKAFALLVYAEMRQSHHERALAACRRGRALFPHDRELRFREGVLLHEMGQFAEARDAYLGALAEEEDRHFSSVDKGLNGFMAHQNLAVVATDMGDLAEAERRWTLVTREVPEYRQGWRGLGDVLIRGQRFAEAQQLSDELMKEGALRAEGLLLRSRLALLQERIDEARQSLETGAAEFPDDKTMLGNRCQFLFEHGTSDEAERALRLMIDRDPTDAEAHHNLGTLFMRSRRHDEAVVAYRQSLRYRPNYPATYLNLGYALKDSGRIEEAASAWEQAARLNPTNPAPRQELLRLGR